MRCSISLSTDLSRWDLTTRSIFYTHLAQPAHQCITHSIGGTLVQHIKEHKLHCDIKPGDVVFYFTTCGWMMWNWLVSVMLSKASILVYEGSPFYPGPERLWQIAEAEKVSLFGTSAKYIDALRKSETYPAQIADLSALKTLCSQALSEEGFDFIYTHQPEPASCVYFWRHRPYGLFRSWLSCQGGLRRRNSGQGSGHECADFR